MEIIDSESVRNVSDDELHKLGNRAWYDNNVELCWLIQTETIHRQRKRFEGNMQVLFNGEEPGGNHDTRTEN